MATATNLKREHVEAMLLRSLAEGRLSHAYVFSGAKGTGKCKPRTRSPRRSFAWSGQALRKAVIKRAVDAQNVGRLNTATIRTSL